jgi:hypothetical protein
MTVVEPGADAKGFSFVAHTDLEGHGPTMGLSIRGDVVYVAHTKRDPIATSVVDVSDPAQPQVVHQIPRTAGTTSHKVIAVGDLLLQSCEREQVWEGPPFVKPTGGADEWTPGLRIFDVSADPRQPVEIGFFETPGDGVHRMSCQELPLAFLSASDTGYSDQFLRIVDLSDPRQPREVGRWWYPGMHTAGGERERFPEGRRYALHHGLPDGDLLFCPWWDAGLVILDIADPTVPQFVSNLNWGPERSGATHTALPLAGRDLFIVADEAIVPGRDTIDKNVWVVDVRDPYSPRVVATLPVPRTFYDRGGRSGPHNLAEARPETACETERVYLTCFNAGLRVYDVSDPADPRETAYYVPGPRLGVPVPQTDDVVVTPDGLVFLTDRAGGGLTILERES